MLENIPTLFAGNGNQGGESLPTGTKALYGLPQSGKLWKDKLNEILTNLGWTRMADETWSRGLLRTLVYM